MSFSIACRSRLCRSRLLGCFIAFLIFVLASEQFDAETAPPDPPARIDARTEYKAQMMRRKRRFSISPPRAPQCRKTSAFKRYPIARGRRAQTRD